MALVLNDRVRETTTIVGTGTATLLGADTGYQDFSVVGNGNTTYYCIADQGGPNWEVGIGTYTSAGTTLARTTVLASSNGGALVSFTAGTKDVFVTYPSERAVYGDASNQVTLASQLNLTNASNYNLYASGAGANYLAGSLGIGAVPITGTSVYVSSLITGAVNSQVVRIASNVQSDVTTEGRGVISLVGTQAATFTLATLRQFYAGQGTFGLNSVVTSQYGYHADSSLTGATNNYAFSGSIAAGTGRYNLYMGGTAANYLAGNTQFNSRVSVGAGPFSDTGVRLGGTIGTAATLNGIYQDITFPATTTASAYGYTTVLATAAAYTLPSLTHIRVYQGTFSGNVTTQYGFECSSTLTGATNNYGFYGSIAAGTGRYNLYMGGTAANYLAGDLQLAKTVTAGGTTGAQTINKTTGTVNFAAAATSLVVTNSLVTTSSIIIATVGTNDTTMKSVQVVAGAGSFTIYANAAATAETRVNFLITN